MSWPSDRGIKKRQHVATSCNNFLPCSSCSWQQPVAFSLEKLQEQDKNYKRIKTPKSIRSYQTKEPIEEIALFFFFP
jgi:hypothetical protein